jgi:RND family efflux transporter MFP subunit
MLIVLGLFFFIVWLVFFKLQWLPWTKAWKYTIWSIAAFIAFFVVGALQYYTPASSKALVEAHAQYIYPQVSGPIQAVYIDGSQTVKAGEKLYLIDPRPFQYAVDNWTAAEKLAGIALRDAETLIKTGAIPRITLDQRRAEHQQAQAQLRNAQYNLDNTLVTAPADGLITLNTLRPGQQVSPNNATLSFIDTSTISIVAVMKQNGLSGIAPGKPVSLTFNAAPGEIYQSTVIRMVSGVIQGQVTVESNASPIDTINAAPNAYPIAVAFPEGAPEQLKQPGKLASVTVFTDEGNPINILAKILLWISTWMDFIV